MNHEQQPSRQLRRAAVALGAVGLACSGLVSGCASPDTINCNEGVVVPGDGVHAFSLPDDIKLVVAAGFLRANIGSSTLELPISDSLEKQTTALVPGVNLGQVRYGADDLYLSVECT